MSVRRTIYLKKERPNRNVRVCCLSQKVQRANAVESQRVVPRCGHKSEVKIKSTSHEKRTSKRFYKARQLHSTTCFIAIIHHLHPTCLQRGFIAQSVEHRTSITEAMGSNPIGASEFFLGFICNCKQLPRSLSLLFFIRSLFI